MSELYRCEEWQGAGSGIWYCEHTSSFPRNVQKWVVPARILGLTPADVFKAVKKCKILIISGFICLFLGLIIPSQETCYKMLAANIVTPNNIEVVGNTATDIVDYIVENVDKLLKEEK